MDGLFSRLRAYQLHYLKIKRDRGAPWGSKGRSAAAALWLPSPMRQRVKLKTGDEQYINSETSSE